MACSLSTLHLVSVRQRLDSSCSSGDAKLVGVGKDGRKKTPEPIDGSPPIGRIFESSCLDVQSEDIQLLKQD